MNKEELETRLIEFATKIIFTTNDLKKCPASKTLTSQLLRSGTSPALNYGESRSAESRKDFIHKLQIVLKELRETRVALRIIFNAGLFRESENLRWCINESNELIAIFVKSVQSLHRIK